MAPPTLESLTGTTDCYHSDSLITSSGSRHRDFLFTDKALQVVCILVTARFKFSIVRVSSISLLSLNCHSYHTSSLPTPGSTPTIQFFPCFPSEVSMASYIEFIRQDTRRHNWREDASSWPFFVSQFVQSWQNELKLPTWLKSVSSRTLINRTRVIHFASPQGSGPVYQRARA